MTTLSAPTPRAYCLRKSSHNSNKKRRRKNTRDYRQQRQLLGCKKVAYRLDFHADISAPEAAATNLKVKIDDLRLPGINTRLDGSRLYLDTQLRCSAGKQHIKKTKNWLYNLLDPLVASAIMETTEEATPRSVSHVRPLSVKSRIKKQRRLSRQNHPRYLVPARSNVDTPDKASPSPTITPVAVKLAHRIAGSTSTGSPLDPDELSNELAQGLLVPAAV